MAYAPQAPWPQQPVAGWGGGQTGTGPGGRAEFATPAYPQQTPWPHAPQQPVWGGQPWTGPGGGAAFATPAYPQQAPWNPHPGNTVFTSARKRLMLFFFVIAVVFIPLGIAGVPSVAASSSFITLGGISAFGVLFIFLYGTTRREGGRGNGGDGGGAGGACGGGGCGDALICMPCAWHAMRVSRVLSVCVYVCM